MKKQTLFALGLSLAFVPAAHSQDPQNPPPQMPVMEALDKNRDQVFDKDEIEAATASLLTLDKNSDGQLTIEEVRPAPPENGSDQSSGDDAMSPSERRRLERERQRAERQSRHSQGRNSPGQEQPNGPPPKMPVMEALDKNRDQVFDKNEIEAATASLLKLDKNRDGKLTLEEIRPAPPRNGSGQGQPQGPPPSGH